MKKQLLLTIFVALMLTFSNSKKENNNLKKSRFSQQDEDLMKQLFTGAPPKCKSPEALIDEAQEEAQKNKKAKLFEKGTKSDLWWVKAWGYGPSAYLFDFLEPVMLNKFIEEGSKIYSDAKAIDNTRDGNYLDPFDYKNFISDDMSDAEKERFLNDYKLINSNYVKEIYDISINAVQLHKLMKDWKWITSPTGDYSRVLVDNYDADGDGRLNVREFLLATIDYNRLNYGKSGIKNLFNESIGVLNAMFTFIDCNEDGYVSAEELWKNLKNLKRPVATDYNIFGANESFRITAVNDFFIKIFDSKNGLLNKTEFMAGILLGFWNRQTTSTQVVKDGSRSLIALRWENKAKDKAFIKSLS